MKQSKKIVGYSLLILGSFLEIFYYYHRYTSDGTNWIVSLIIGITLTVLLLGLTILREYNTIKILIIVLISFSIFTTSAGQAFSFATVQSINAGETVKQMNAQDRLDEIKIELDEFYLEKKNNQAVVNETVKSLKDAAVWRTAKGKMDARNDNLDIKIEALKTERSTLRASQTIRADVEKPELNIYAFYNGLFHIDKTWLQFFLQTLLSAFIAITAPFGVILIQHKPAVVEPAKRQINWKPYVDLFVERNWVMVWSKQENPRMLKWESWAKAYSDMSQRKFIHIKRIAKENGCIDKNGMIKELNQERAKSKILRDLRGGK